MGKKRENMNDVADRPSGKDNKLTMFDLKGPNEY